MNMTFKPKVNIQLFQSDMYKNYPQTQSNKLNVKETKHILFSHNRILSSFICT